MLKKTKTTSRKFYNKWLYKVSLTIPGSGIFRVFSIDDLKDLRKEEVNVHQTYSIRYKAWINREEISELADFLSLYDSTIWTKRLESNLIDFYTNDPQFYTALSEKFESALVHRFEPAAGSSDLLDQPETILATKFPHGRYRYKAYLLPHKLAGDKEAKRKFVDWVKGQSPRITCTAAVEKWFIKTDWNWDRRYVLVEDEQTLLMLKLRNSEVVGRVYNYVISDK